MIFLYPYHRARRFRDGVHATKVASWLQRRNPYYGFKVREVSDQRYVIAIKEPGYENEAGYYGPDY